MINFYCRAALFCAGMYCVAVDAANPATLFVFDGSGSMWGQVQGQAKVDLAKQALNGLLQDFPRGTDIGLIAYGHRRKGDCSDIETLAPVGSSKAEIIAAVNSINPKGKTPLTRAIGFAAEQLKGRDASTSIVVISDGKESCNADPCAMAKTVHQSGVDLRVHVIGFDVSKEEAEQLQCIAKNGGGKYFPADSAGELANSFAAVRKEVVETGTQAAAQPKTTRVLFRDDFNGNSLSEKWQLRNPDPDAMTVDGGVLYLLSEPGDWQAENVHNLLTYVDAGSLPRNWNAVTRFSTEVLDYPGGGNEASWVGIVLYLDKDNHLDIPITGHCCSDRRSAHFSKMSKGRAVPGYEIKLGGLIKKPVNYYLKLEKRGFSYTAYVSEDGLDWQKIGTHKFLGKKFAPGLFSVRHSRAVETTSAFDWFEIQAVQ